jgi:hypothetical protein
MKLESTFPDLQRKNSALLHVCIPKHFVSEVDKVSQTQTLRSPDL